VARQLLCCCAMRAISLLGFFLAIGCGGRALSIVEDGGASSVSGSSAGGDSVGGAVSAAGDTNAGGAVSGGSAGAANAGSTAGGDASAGSANGGASTGGALGSGGASCLLQCPSPFLELQLAVMSSAGIGEVSGVQATLLGNSVTVPLNCSGFAGTTYCFPTEGGPEGVYLLEVTAPGFQTAVVSITVTFTPSQGFCGCASASANPSTVTINPTRL
jgi:hypothetical protein